MSAAILDPKKADGAIEEKNEREPKKIKFRRILLEVKKGESFSLENLQALKRTTYEARQAHVCLSLTLVETCLRVTFVARRLSFFVPLRLNYFPLLLTSVLFHVMKYRFTI